MSRYTVIHLVDDYLPRSQTFIYQYLSKMRAVRPVVITQNPSNQDLFPLDNIAAISQQGWMRKLRERLIMRLAADFLPLTNQYAAICCQYKGNILHAHFGHVGYRALTLKQKTSLPLVTTFYGFDMSLLPRRKVWKHAYQILFAKGDRFLVEGPHMAEKLIQLGCPEDKVTIRPIAIDISKIPFIPRNGDRQSPIRILMVGRFVEKKGFIYAIQAFACIASKWPNVEVRIIGDGPQKGKIIAEIEKQGLLNRVHLLGPKNYESYLEEAKNAHIFLSPSVTASDGDSEGGAPTTLLEMQGSGMPVLSTYHADIPYVVKQGATGFLVPERDVSALAVQLDWLLSQPGKWESIGKAGRKSMLKSHNIENEITKLEELYLQILSTGR